MIGIDISDRSVKVVQLSNDQQHKLQSYCWQDVPIGAIEGGVVQQPELVQRVITEALKGCNIGSRFDDSVVASIPEAESFMRVVEIPPMEEGEVSEAVQWEVAQHIPFGLENVYLDWQWVPRGKDHDTDRYEVLVGAAEKRVVDPLVRLLMSLNLDVAALELENQSIVRSLVSAELRAKKGLLVVDLGGSSTNVVIHDRGTIRFTATLHKGAGRLLNALSPQEQQEISGPPAELSDATLQAIGPKLQAGLDALVVEVHGIVEFYTGLDSQHQVNEVLLTGGGSNLPGLDQSFVRYFDDVHVQRGNPWVNILPSGEEAKPPMGLWESVHYSTALGLALRPVVF